MASSWRLLVKLYAQSISVLMSDLNFIFTTWIFAGVRADDFVEVRIAWRRQAQAGDTSAELLQPKRKPRTFEAGVAGDEDALAVVEVEKHHQTFHGALPLFHIPASNCSSR